MIVPVILPAILIGFAAAGFFVAVTDGLELARAHATLNQGLAGSIGPALTQSEVVHSGAALVAVALDLDFPLGMGFDEFGRLAQHLLCVGTKLGFVVVEVD